MISVAGTVPVGGIDTLYTCVNGAGARIDSLNLVNVSGLQATINVLIKVNFTDFHFTAQNQQLGSGSHARNANPIYMLAGQTIEASTSVGPVEFTLQGVEFGIDPPTA